MGGNERMNAPNADETDCGEEQQQHETVWVGVNSLG
jgi:hypothetical protein